MAELSFAEVDALLKYEPETGKLFWKERVPEMFKSQRDCNAWNARWSGEEAFAASGNHGYKYGKVLGVEYLAHRVIWLLHTGSWPADQVDHVNGARSDNRLSNLRAVSRAENAKNKRLRVDNTSGVHGVYWRPRYQKWGARIEVGGKTKHLGYFDDKNAAIDARKRSEAELGYHANHGIS